MKGTDFLTADQLNSIAGDLENARNNDDHDWDNIRGGRPLAELPKVSESAEQSGSAGGVNADGSGNPYGSVANSTKAGGNGKLYGSGTDSANADANRSADGSGNAGGDSNSGKAGINWSAVGTTGAGNKGKSSKESRRQAKRREKRERKEDRRRDRRGKKSITPLKVFVTIIVIIMALLVAGIAGLLYLRYKGSQDLQQAVVQEEAVLPETAAEQDDGSILYNGQKYWYNNNLINILLLGIDKEASTSSDQSIGENGQADTLLLASIDKTTGQLTLLNISREAMADVTTYNTAGEYAGVENMQICLAYAYGDGHESSCQNVATSVSKLLYGMPIHGYAAIDYSALSGLNDTVGGVTVQVMEDLTEKDPELVYGSWVTLQGNQAITYIRSRDTNLLDSNNYRMQRQKQYLTAFLQKTFSSVKSNPTLVPTLYSQASEKMVTDVGLSDVVYLTSIVAEHGFTEANMCSVVGDIVQGPEYAEFQVDKTALYDQIIQIFYTQTKN